MPLFRNALVLLLAVTLGGAAIAQSFGDLGSADCTVQQAQLSDDGCCGGAAAPGPACALCTTGCVLFMPATAPRKSAEYRFASPSIPPRSSSASHQRAPDTAPPKSSFA